MSDSKLNELTAAVKRIEAFHGAVDHTLRAIMTALEVHNEKLDAVLLAATREPGPSPVAQALGQIVTALNTQTELLTALPEALAETIRDELERDAALDDLDREPAEPGSFDQPGDA
jgi:hypothetical protein